MAGGLLTALTLVGPEALAAAPPSLTVYVSPTGHNQSGTGASTSPYRTIDFAVSKVPAGSTIIVMPGTYNESPIIAQTVTITGETGQAAKTIINADGYNNAIWINGAAAKGTTIAHLTLEHANNEGILVSDTSQVTITHDVITQNGMQMSPTVFEDKAITMMGSTGSTITDNLITQNAGGGVALTDDGTFSPGLAYPFAYHPPLPSQGNTIANNTITNNTKGCGIVVASFNSAGSIGNTVSGNTVSGNPQGIDIGVAPMGSKSINNVVTGNIITNNQIPGILVHLTAPGQTMSGTQVINNSISSNGPDPEFGLMEPTGIAVMGTGSEVGATTITHNTISQEYYGVWMNHSSPVTGVAQNTTTGVAVPQTVVVPPPTLTLKGPTGTAPLGTPLTYAASSSASLEYQFWLGNAAGQWKVIQNYSTGSSVTLNTLAAGTYTVVAYGMTPTQLAKGSYQDAVGQSAIVNVGGNATLSAGPSLGTVGHPETLDASSRNVSGALYQFWIKTPENAWIASGSYGSSQFAFTPPVPGVYQAVVYAKAPNAVSNATEATMATTTFAVSPAPNGLVALGDSISYGFNLGPNLEPSPLAFPYLMGKFTKLPVNDLAVPGWTSKDLLTALPTPAFAGSLKSAKIVTINIGSNDLLGIALKDGLFYSGQTTLTPTEASQVQQAIAGFGTNLTQIVTLVRQEAPTAKIVLYNLYNPVPVQMVILNAMVNAPLVAMNATIAKVAQAANIPVANAYTAFAGHQQLDVLTGDIHPTISGQVALAQAGDTALHLGPIVIPVN